MQNGRSIVCRLFPGICGATLLQEKLDASNILSIKESCQEKHPYHDHQGMFSKEKSATESYSVPDTPKITKLPSLSSSAGATFRKRRLTKAHHPSEETDHTLDHEQRDRDTFLYASEIEGLDEEHPLQTPHLEHTLNGSLRTSNPKLPFSDRTVGAFSCHGLEPLNLRRYMTDVRLKADSISIRADAFLMEKNPVIRKINQDRGAIAHPYANDRHIALFSVFDGHGQFGDQVANFSMVQMLSKLKNHPGAYHTSFSLLYVSSITLQMFSFCY